MFSVQWQEQRCVVKQRFPKRYRHPALDAALSRSRLLAECRAMAKVRRLGVDCPCVWLCDERERCIVMEHVDGELLKDALSRLERLRQREAEQPAEGGRAASESASLMRGLGRLVGALHAAGVIHGDLTSSNIMCRRGAGAAADSDGSPRLCALDFGLSVNSLLVEDRAVDLYVLERAFLSTHPRSQPLFDAVLNAYLLCARDGSKVLQKLISVRQRGRKKLMLG